jgi:DNA invertase Pin-like site-specific DNA recombinase
VPSPADDEVSRRRHTAERKGSLRHLHPQILRLQQEFNSLLAQREACEAFINSQRHEGWVCVRAAYDDGGFSGATLDRPALQRLLADIAAGRVDTVVVYKIDRLTRSLADFAKIVEILNTRGASFVSVTQQFNTTTSMGRSPMTSRSNCAKDNRTFRVRRIRDKIAASKRKGMWMGGVPPFRVSGAGPQARHH